MRNCGDCTACCTLCFVPELDKGEGTKCEHCSNGCMIYEGRPQSCSDYQCAWLTGELPEAMRPDLCGAMVEVYPKMVAVMLLPGHTIQGLSKDTLATLDEFVADGKPVIATGQFAKIPEGMSAQEAKTILVETVREHRHGASSV